MTRNGKIPKTTSLKKIAANRNNARKSTGPKTANGKAASKMNAVKHGILSSEVVVQGLKTRESSREFAALRQQFWQDRSPVGPMEEMLVERIVTTYWRLRRAVTAESGEIALNVDGGHWQRRRPDRLAHQFVLAALSPLTDVAQEMEEFAGGLGYLKEVLQQVRAAVENDGELTDAALQETHYGGKANSLTKRLADLRSVPVADTDGLDEAAAKAKRRDQILTAIDRMLERYDWKQRRATEREDYEEWAHQAAAVLPSAETLDKIMRYETTLDRQLYRAMNQLERLQRRRNGEVVPPPISMEVTH